MPTAEAAERASAPLALFNPRHDLMLPALQSGISSTCADDPNSLSARLTTLVCTFSHHLASQRSGCLAQLWVPGVREDGSVTLHTQVSCEEFWCQNSTCRLRSTQLYCIFSSVHRRFFILYDVVVDRLLHWHSIRSRHAWLTSTILTPLK